MNVEKYVKVMWVLLNLKLRHIHLFSRIYKTKEESALELHQIVVASTMRKTIESNKICLRMVNHLQLQCNMQNGQKAFIQDAYEEENHSTLLKNVSKPQI